MVIGGKVKARAADMSGLSAIDMALWDLYAQRAGVPLYEALGGLSRPSIRVYNTCAGYSYGVNRAGRLDSGDLDLPSRVSIRRPAGVSDRCWALLPTICCPRAIPR